MEFKISGHAFILSRETYQDWGCRAQIYVCIYVDWENLSVIKLDSPKISSYVEWENCQDWCAHKRLHLYLVGYSKDVFSCLMGKRILVGYSKFLSCSK